MGPFWLTSCHHRFWYMNKSLICIYDWNTTLHIRPQTYKTVQPHYINHGMSLSAIFLTTEILAIILLISLKILSLLCILSINLLPNNNWLLVATKRSWIENCIYASVRACVWVGGCEALVMAFLWWRFLYAQWQKNERSPSQRLLSETSVLCKFHSQNFSKASMIHRWACAPQGQFY